MSIVKLFRDVEGDVCHGLYARKGLQIRKISDIYFELAMDSVGFFYKPSRSPLIRVVKTDARYNEFVHHAILEALWLDGEPLNNEEALAVLARLDKNTE